MDSIEIADEEIDVEDIMRQVRENIRKRRESGMYTQEMEALINEPLQSFAGSEQAGFQADLDYITSNWSVQADYVISSHRKILGRPLIVGRQLIHEEVKRYVDLIVEKQNEFNTHVAQSIMGLLERVNEGIFFIRRDLDIRINKAISVINKDIENKAWLANVLEDRIKEDMIFSPSGEIDDVLNYFLFEEKHRGSTKDIRRRQSIFQEYFTNCRNVLDIGCGRGEFLSLLKEKGICAKGIDINEDMILFCQKNGLDVQKADALAYLQSIEEETLDGVFSSQVIEHLQPEELIGLIKLSYDKMKCGAYFVAETINPLCLTTYALFHVDLSHVKPVHPETMKFLLESVGFKEIRLKFLSPYPKGEKLKKFVIIDGMSCKERAMLEVMNQNLEKLNSLLYGYQEYAVIAKK